MVAGDVFRNYLLDQNVGGYSAGLSQKISVKLQDFHQCFNIVQKKQLSY